MNADEPMWFCFLEHSFINLGGYEANGVPVPCGPNLQCTGGRRAGLPCGWYRLVEAEVTA